MRRSTLVVAAYCLLSCYALGACSRASAAAPPDGPTSPRIVWQAASSANFEGSHGPGLSRVGFDCTYRAVYLWFGAAGVMATIQDLGSLTPQADAELQQVCG